MREKSKEDVRVELQRSQPSVELKKDAKGAMSCVVKVYADTAEEAYDEAVATMNKALEYMEAKQ